MKKILKVLITLVVLGTVMLFAIKIPAVGLSSNEFCASCHVMEPQSDSFLHSAHALAGNTCSDCHMPHSLGYGAVAKAWFGLKDFIGVVRDEDPFMIHATDNMKDITHHNCIRCHGTMMLEVGDPLRDGGRRCFDCHRNTPHETYPNSSPAYPRSLESETTAEAEYAALEINKEQEVQFAEAVGLEASA